MYMAISFSSHDYPVQTLLIAQYLIIYSVYYTCVFMNLLHKISTPVIQFHQVQITMHIFHL